MEHKHQTVARRVLRLIGETWQEPLGWAFRVRWVPAHRGYEIAAVRNLDKEWTRMVITPKDAAFYRTVIAKIKELEARALEIEGSALAV